MCYVFLANGFEEAEALVPVDLLRRAGVQVATVGVTGREVNGAHGICVRADLLPEEYAPEGCEGILLPGGMPGTKNLAASDSVRNAVQRCVDAGALLCAICAAPSVPGEMGLLKGKKAVCYPGFESKLLGAQVSSDVSVRDGNVITARGAGCVFSFSHKIIAALRGVETADRVIKEIICTL